MGFSHPKPRHCRGLLDFCPCHGDGQQSTQGDLSSKTRGAFIVIRVYGSGGIRSRAGIYSRGPDQLVTSEAISNVTNWGGDMYIKRSVISHAAPVSGKSPMLPLILFQLWDISTGNAWAVARLWTPPNARPTPFRTSLSASADYPPYLGLLVPTSGQSIPYRGTSMAFHD